MRPSRRDHQDTIRYRRQRQSSGGINAARLSIILTISVGIVVAALAITNNYEFSAIPEPTRIAGSQNNLADRINRGSGTEASDLVAAAESQASASSGSSSSGSSGASTESNSPSSGTSSGTTSESSNSGSTGSSATGDQTNPTEPEEPIVKSETVVAGCTIHGRVTDDWGSSMVGLRVFATTSDGTVVGTTTDSRGRYTLPGPTPDAMSMTVLLTHAHDSGDSFSVMKGDDVISLSTSIDPETTGCEVNFDSWNVQEQMIASPISSDLWPDAASIYQYTRNAESLAVSMGADIEGATTLQVQAWCEEEEFGCIENSNSAYFIAENELEDGSPPVIALLPARSSSSSPGVPDNREYHEYGHYFLSLQTGDNFELPPGDTNHGGYYKNSSTRDSFVEGFAEFYSMMVSRHIDDDPNAEIYTIGADYNLETDRLPWEAEGWWEEFTVAGLLLDLVDDDSDYLADSSKFAGVNILEVTTSDEPSGTIITGEIVNSSPLVVRDADVTVRYLDDQGEVVGTQVTRILPEVIAPTRQGTFFAAPPAGVNVVDAIATVGGIAKPDDDDMSIGLVRLMSLITEYERPTGEQGVSTVSELYDALLNSDSSTASGSATPGEISSSVVDEIFVSHGFFADLDGNREYNPDIDGEIGSSSHPVFEVGEKSFPAFVPRNDPDPYEGSFVTIDTGEADVNAVIQISMPANGGADSYAYVAPAGSGYRVELAVPPANQDADVTIITAGKDFRPVIAFRVEADNFHEKVDNGTISELQVAPVKLAPGATLEDPNDNAAAIQFGVMLGGIAAVIIVVASLVAIRRQWGKA